MNDAFSTAEYGRIPEASRRYGLSRSRLYLLAGEGSVRFIKVGSATLVDLGSVRDYLASCPSAQVRPPKSAAYSISLAHRMSETAILVEITRLAKAGGPLTKRISLNADGSLKSDGSACVMSWGRAQRACFDTLQAFAAQIASLERHEAIALGALRHDLPDEVEITTKDRLEALNGSATPHLIARTSDHIGYRPNAAALALIDIDTKGMPPTVRNRLREVGGYWAALISIVPELEQTGHVMRRSTSSGIRRTDTCKPVPGSDGVHVFVLVKDGADIERFLRTLHTRCWLNGLGWMMVGAGGQLLERSIVDRMVYAPERLVFEGAPIVQPPLVQDPAVRKPAVMGGRPLHTQLVCLDLSAVENARLRASTIRTSNSGWASAG